MLNHEKLGTICISMYLYPHTYIYMYSSGIIHGMSFICFGFSCMCEIQNVYQPKNPSFVVGRSL